MSERHIRFVTDDGCEIELRWEKGAKFVLEVNEKPVDSSAETAKSEAVSPDAPASTAPADLDSAANAGSVLEQRRDAPATESVLSTDVYRSEP